MTVNEAYRFPGHARLELLDRVRKELRYRLVHQKASPHHLGTNVLGMPPEKVRRVMLGSHRPHFAELLDMALNLGFQLELTIGDPRPTPVILQTENLNHE